MASKLKFCFFGTYKPTYARNTILKDGLTKLGHHVTEVNFPVDDMRMELPEDYTLMTTLKRVGRKIGVSARLLSNWRSIQQSDVVLVLQPGHLDLPVAWLLSKVFGRPLFFDNSISPYDTMFVGRSIADQKSLKARVVWLVEKMCLMMVDKVIVDTKAMAVFMVETFRISAQKIIVVPLGANEQMYQPRKETKKKSNSAVQVFFFGLFNPLHGLPSIMEAIKLLKKESGIEFTILGDGYLKEELHDFAKKHDLKNLKFHGFVQEKELVTFIQDCDIMLGIFSKNPTMVKVVPNKVFAGLACKRAVITAKLPSTESTFEHGKDIYLCEPEDPKSLADAIKKLVKDKTLRDNIAAAGYKSYQDKFTSTSIIKPLIKEAEARI